MILQGIPKLLTVQEVADYLHQKPKTIRNWILSGELPGIKVGRHWFIVEDDLREYIETRSGMLLAKVGVGKRRI
jgi:excisionase family DNA binding protein